MGYRLGRDGKTYRNTGSYASPVWNEIDNIREVTLNLEGEKADVATRKNGVWGAKVTVELMASVDFQMVWDSSDTDFLAISTAFFALSTIEFLVLDGAVATAGSRGLRATCTISKFSRSEKLKEAMLADVSIEPAYADNAPSWYVAA